MVFCHAITISFGSAWVAGKCRKLLSWVEVSAFLLGQKYTLWALKLPGSILLLSNQHVQALQARGPYEYTLLLFFFFNNRQEEMQWEQL